MAPVPVPDDADIEERFVRASGPGGQNVNKVATAVELRFDLGRTAALDEAAKARLRALAGTRMTADDILVIDARRYRSQAKNREDARARLLDLLARASKPPVRRRATRVPRAAKEKRVEAKRLRARTKAQRGRVVSDD